MSKYITLERLQLFLTSVKGLIPTKTSQLTNDSGFIKTQYVLPVATSSNLGGIKVGANVTVTADGTISVPSMAWANIQGRPTKVSEFTNDSGFITKSVTDLANYYTKANTYTKTEVTALIGDIKSIEIVKVTTLPATGESNKIYLVPANPASADNNYIEYIWVTSDSKFESIGDTKIDLSGYWSKTELVEATAAEINALFTS